MVKQLNINQSLLIALDLRQPHYQSLLIIYLKIIKKNIEIKIECEIKGLKMKQTFYNCKKSRKNN